MQKTKISWNYIVHRIAIGDNPSRIDDLICDFCIQENIDPDDLEGYINSKHYNHDVTITKRFIQVTNTVKD